MHFALNVFYINCTHPCLLWICQFYYLIIIVSKKISLVEYYMKCRKIQGSS